MEIRYWHQALILFTLFSDCRLSTPDLLFVIRDCESVDDFEDKKKTATTVMNELWAENVKEARIISCGMIVSLAFLLMFIFISICPVPVLAFFVVQSNGESFFHFYHPVFRTDQVGRGH